MKSQSKNREKRVPGRLFKIEMLPACEGDCLLLTWGTKTRFYHALIDGGRARTYTALKKRLERIPSQELTFELFVISHIDRDHIEGAVAVLEDPNRPIRFRDIWFNGYDHLLNKKVETFGAVQGERLSTALLRNRLPWNKAFSGGAVETNILRPVTKKLAGGLKLTLLSPDRNKLEALIPVWESACREAGLIPGIKARKRELGAEIEVFGRIDIRKLAKMSFEEDRSEPNGTSIAFLAEYGGECALLAADAHPGILEQSLATLEEKRKKRLGLSVMKVAHHGSARNTSPSLLKRVVCSKFLVSTNGSIYHHPDQLAMARLITLPKRRKELFFNYKSDETKLWENQNWKRDYVYSTRYPERGEDGTMSVAILSI
jgi:beta-lactamase superfamily II metal-dependent hydrolase